MTFLSIIARACCETFAAVDMLLDHALRVEHAVGACAYRLEALDGVRAMDRLHACESQAFVARGFSWPHSGGESWSVRSSLYGPSVDTAMAWEWCGPEHTAVIRIEQRPLKHDS